MRRRTCGLSGFCFVVGASVLACGGDSGGSPDAPIADGDAASDAGADAAADASADAVVDAPSVCAGAPSVVFALQQLHWGEGNSGEWSQVGFNLDGKVSTASSTDLCQPSSGGQASTSYPDGDQGIDNSFGRNVLPILLALDPGFTSDTNNSIANGELNTLFELSCLPASGDVPSLSTKLFVGSPLGLVPKFDGTDVWAVNPTYLSDPLDAGSSMLVFPTGSVTGTSYDAGTGGTVVLSIPFEGQNSTSWFTFKLRAARVTMTLSADRRSATGMIGGVLDTEELVTQIREVGAAVGLCGSVVLDNVITQVRRSSDILANGTQDPGQTCNGISIGLSFEVSLAQRGNVGAAPPADAMCP